MSQLSHVRQIDQARTAARQKISELREVLDEAEYEVRNGSLAHDIRIRLEDKASRVRIAVSDFGRLL